MKESNLNSKAKATFLYLVLSALFIAALITCNLIANKFVTVNLGFRTFTVSAGVLPYPLTFLITDILSEIFGRKRTNQVVFSGFFAILLVVLILYLGHAFPAIADSPVSNHEYDVVFRNSWRVLLASMIAYLVAQTVDVYLFHFWKKVTRGRHLWIRNNFSTMLSQLMDTILVTTVLFIGVQSFDFITGLIWDGWLFKLIFAAADTVVIYLVVYLIRKTFGLKPNEEATI